ncbi:MAG: hypothetical protein ACM31O_03865 [Bacteroidota bacterium]
MKLQAHEIYDVDDDTGAVRDRVIARVHPASDSSVMEVLRADQDSEDGRSQWMWLRLSDGTLMLGIFPQGDTYFACETDARYPHGKRRLS